MDGHIQMKKLMVYALNVVLPLLMALLNQVVIGLLLSVMNVDGHPVMTVVNMRFKE